MPEEIISAAYLRLQGDTDLFPVNKSKPVKVNKVVFRFTAQHSHSYTINCSAGKKTVGITWAPNIKQTPQPSKGTKQVPWLSLDATLELNWNVSAGTDITVTMKHGPTTGAPEEVICILTGVQG
jgi:hypothetical protein